MDRAFEEQYHELEDNHWWFASRRDITIRLIQNIPKSANILEVGCASAPLLKELKDRGYSNLTGIDISAPAIERGGERGLDNLFVMDATKLDFPGNTFDVVIASDVLEHIKEDLAAMKEWFRVLKPGGIILVFVPAFHFLWSSHDVVNHHFRRYTKDRLACVTKTAGFNILRSSYWNGMLFFPVLCIRFLQRFLKTDENSTNDQLRKTNPLINRILKLLLKFENRLLTKIDFTIGVSVFAIATKR